MKSNVKLFRKIITLSLALAMMVAGVSIYQVRQPSTVRAFGELTVDFHVPAGDPIFVVNNMAPGDSESRTIDVTNAGLAARFVAVKGVKKTETGDISDVLSLVIKEGSTDRYGGASPTGPKHLSDFFAESGDPNGVRLSILESGSSTTYTFIVTFDPTAGNFFQAKQVIFDLTFGIITANNLVINEVYYQVDPTHGLDSPKDRGVSAGGNTAQNINTGAGSKNRAKASSKDTCKINQGNTSNISNTVSVSVNTGGNSASGNTGSGSAISGTAGVLVGITNSGSTNQASCGKKLGQNDEWIEIYNPTDEPISLKNWKLVDNSGVETIIHADKKVPAGGFALISKDADTWKFWSESPAAKKIELGSQIGNGLDNGGDHLFLKDPSGDIIDAVGWGADTAVWDPAIPSVTILGSSIERLVLGFDTDLPSDWEEGNPPTPGN